MERLLAILNDVGTAQSVLDSSRLLVSHLTAGTIRVVHPRPEVDPEFLPTEEVWTDDRRQAFEAERNQLFDDLNDIYHGWLAAQANPVAPYELQQVMGPVERTIESEARQADIMVMGRLASRSTLDVRRAFKVALSLGSDAPVVIVPPASPEILGKHPAIAWERSDAAEKALLGMLPILMKSSEVTILMGREGQDQSPPNFLVKALGQENVPVELFKFELSGRQIGEALLAEAKNVGADLLIMGAFSHNRFLESIFGGATEEVLEKLTIPIAMHH